MEWVLYPPLVHDPQSHMGWGVGYHRLGMPPNRVSPVGTDIPRKNPELVTTYKYTKFIFLLTLKGKNSKIPFQQKHKKHILFCDSATILVT